MTSLICAISNEVPEQPVVSPVSGQVYERRLIEKFLADNGVDPVNKVDHNIVIVHNTQYCFPLTWN